MAPSENPKPPISGAITKRTSSVRTGPYQKLEKDLPPIVFDTSVEKYKIFRKNPHDSILGNHTLHGKHADKRAVWINGSYRAVYRVEEKDDETVFVWLWVGNHAQYDDEFN